jgi:hypothetical protein
MTPEQFIAKVPEPSRSDLAQVHALIRRTAASLEPYMASGKLIGYGRFRYRYESGREGDSCRVGLALGASGISLYVLAVDKGGYLAEQAAPTLGKAKVGKSCIRFKRIADLDLGGLTKLLARAAKLPAPGEITSTLKAAPTGTKKASAEKKAVVKKKRAPR